MRPAVAQISKAALIHNVREINRQIQSQTQLHHKKAYLMAIVKADAYGHSIECVVPVLTQENISFLAVASLEEAKEVRALTQLSEILVLGGVFCWTQTALQLA